MDVRGAARGAQGAVSGVEGSRSTESLMAMGREVSVAEKKGGLSMGEQPMFASSTNLLSRVVHLVAGNPLENPVRQEQKKLDREVKDLVQSLMKGSTYEEGVGPSKKCVEKSKHLMQDKVSPRLDKLSKMYVDRQKALLVSISKCGLSKMSTARLTDFVINKLTCSEKWGAENKELLHALGAMICVELEGRTPANATEDRDMQRARFVLSSMDGSSGFCSANKIGEHVPLGSGQLNTVYTSTYQLPGMSHSTTVVYKPVAPPEGVLDFDASGTEPRYNVAVYTLAKAFGEYGCDDIIVETHYASDEGETGIVMEYIDNGKCTVEGKSEKIGELVINGAEWEALARSAPWDANGKALPDPTWLADEGIECYPQYLQLYHQVLGPEYPQDMYEIRKEGDKLVIYGPEIAPVDYTNGTVRKQAVWLQLVDIMTGQTDRHDANAFFVLDSEGQFERLVAFDNDQCYRRKSCPDKDEVERNPNLLLLPRVMDSDMVAAIMGMSDKKLEALLGDDLTQSELDNQKAILLEMKNHCMQLMAEGRVIGPSDWDNSDVGDWLAEKDGDAYSSYVGRFVERNAEAAAGVASLKAKLNPGEL